MQGFNNTKAVLLMSYPITDEFVAGFRFHDFTVTKARPIPELQCRLIELIHEPSKARVLHVQADDQENLFSLSFQTIPSSSNGVAHILEHTVLCGSDKFPVRDPFFSMTRRSMNTFMNALTGSDFTCYPASSQIEQDFYNLLDVYLDAVFHPLLHPLSFMQEAHRFELSENDELCINGVVYNEMKGAMTNPYRRLMNELCKRLFSTSPYGFDSGGDPDEIPTITLEDLKTFHDAYYHPSRCLFFFYGNLPLAQHLDFIEQRVLSKASALPPLPPVPTQTPFVAPIYDSISYPVTKTDTLDEKTYTAFGWLTTPIRNQLECLALLILDTILLETDASPLKYALLQSGLCKQVLSSCDVEIAEVPFVIILTGCNEEDSEALTEILFSTLKNIVHSGVPKEQIEHALHQLEFAKSEINSDHAPFGLSLYSRAALLAHHGIDPINGLAIHSLFQELHQTLQRDPRFFQRLIQTYFLDNHHFVRLTMTPSKTFEEKEREKEKKGLEKIFGKLSEKQKQAIKTQSEELSAFQHQEQSLDSLPILSLSDVPKECRLIPLQRDSIGNADLFSHETFTNGITYASVSFPLPKIALEDMWLVRLFSSLLPQLGCGNRTYTETLEYLQAYTGGVRASLSLHRQASDFNAISPTWILKGKALDRNLDKLFAIFIDFLLSARFDNPKRIFELLEKQLIDLENSITSHALDYAMSLSAASLSPTHTISEQWNGITYLKNLKALVKTYSSEQDAFLEKLTSFQHSLLLNDGMHITLCGESKTLLHLQENQLFGLADLTTTPFHPWENPAQPASYYSDQGVIIPSNVSFTSAVIQTTPYASRDAATLYVLSHLINNVVLHQALREKGGAYGGGSSCHPIAGTFSFYSYKDPNLSSTLKEYEHCFEMLLQGSIKESDLIEAKLNILQDLDTPISPGSRAEVAYSWWKQGRDTALRQHFRDKVFATSKEDIEEIIPRYFPNGWSKNRFVAFAGKELFDKEQASIDIALRSL